MLELMTCWTVMIFVDLIVNTIRSFHAHLSPSNDVFYPGARFTYLGEDVEPHVFYKGQLKGKCILPCWCC